MLGSANFTAGPLMAFMSGNLCYQIEHHLFPDLPSNRHAEISERVKALCDKYDLPYTTGSLMHQYMQTFSTILRRLSVPNKFLQGTSDDAPETHSELKFRIREGVRESFGVEPAPADVAGCGPRCASFIPVRRDKCRYDNVFGTDSIPTRRVSSDPRGGRASIR